MTRDDVKKMIVYLQMAYPSFGKDADLSALVSVWYDEFRNDDVKIVSMATKNYVGANEYHPSIAGIKKQIKLIEQTETDTDLWAHILKAASNATYNSAAEFEKLPEECKSFVGSASALKELALTDGGTLNTIVKGQFLKRVEAIKEHQEVQKGLPAEVKQAIEASRMKMLEEGE